MFTSLTYFVLLSSVMTVDDNQFRCDYRYSQDVQGWLKLHRVPSNWFEARLRCHLEGGNLASPLNSSFQNAMKFLIDEETSDMSCGVFTGIHAFFSKGDFQSIEGVPLWKIPHTWAVGEPDNFKDEESCIALLLDGSIADVDCQQPLPYICYKEKTETMFVSGCGTTDKEYVYDAETGSCYKFHTLPRTWSRASMVCAAEGGHLVVINSDREAQVVKEIFAKHSGELAYAGIYDWNEHGEWLTVHGQTLAEAGYSKFSGGEPNNGSASGEFCVGVYKTALFNDVPCESKNAFICEKSPNSLLCDP
ncbi:unnamed protein product, partial [Iphiclides podalirius]